MGIKILVPVKRSIKLHRNKDQTSAILKGISDIIYKNINKDKMISFFERKSQASKQHDLRLFEIMFNNEQPQNDPSTSQKALKEI